MARENDSDLLKHSGSRIRNFAADLRQMGQPISGHGSPDAARLDVRSNQLAMKTWQTVERSRRRDEVNLYRN